MLLLSLLLCSFLSVMILGAAGSLLLAGKVRKSMEQTTQLFYLAEAGLAHGQAYCRTLPAWPAGPPEGEEESSPAPEATPFERWISWGPGQYFLSAWSMADDPHSPIAFRDQGILIRSTGATGEDRRKSLLLLVEEPPSCRALSWYEPE